MSSRGTSHLPVTPALLAAYAALDANDQFLVSRLVHNLSAACRLTYQPMPEDLVPPEQRDLVRSLNDPCYENKAVLRDGVDKRGHADMSTV